MHAAMTPQRKDANAKVIKKLAQSLREYKKPTILTLIFITGEVFFEVLIPFFTADLVNAIKAFSAAGLEAAGLHDVVCAHTELFI